MILNAQFADGYIFKTLLELCHHNFNQMCLELNASGIHFCSMDIYRKICLKFDLTHLMSYAYSLPVSSFIGFNILHLYRIIRSIKKKDQMMFFIEEAKPSELGIRIFSHITKKHTVSYIKFQYMQNIDIQIPTDNLYLNHYTLVSSEFQTLVKELNLIDTQLTIASHSDGIQFKCFSNGIFVKTISYNCEDSSVPFTYEDVFNIEQFIRIFKVSNVHTKLTIHTAPEQPIYIESAIGIADLVVPNSEKKSSRNNRVINVIGSIKIYIKSKKQIDLDELETS